MADLVERLANEDLLFPWSLAAEHRRWFAERVVSQLGSAQPPPSEADLENAARARMTATKDFALATERPAVAGETTTAAARRWHTNDARLEAVYGLAGNDLAVLDDPGRLHIQVERRARMVNRMAFDVGANPHPRGYTDDVFRDGHVRAFEYPFEVPVTPRPGSVAAGLLDVEEKLNPLAAQHWQSLRAGVFVLRQTANDPRQALDAVLTPFDDYFQRNFMGCQQVMAVLHMDALAEIGDPALYATLRGQHDSYLRIGDPSDVNLDLPYAKVQVTAATTGTYTITILGRAFSVDGRQLTVTEIRDALGTEIKRAGLPLHVTAINTDTLGVIPHYLGAVRRDDISVSGPGGALGLWVAGVHEQPEHFFATEQDPALRYFRQGTVAFDSLCVGDHVYVRNHPAYSTFVRGGFWAGEHCLVVRGMGGNILLQGHGVPALTIALMINEMLGAFRPAVVAAQRIVLAHWRGVFERNEDGTPGLPKNRNSNGTTPRLHLRQRPDEPASEAVPIERDMALEQSLPPDRAFATWYMRYKDAVDVQFYLFNAADGTPVEVTAAMIPGLQPGIGGMTPRQVWAIRPDQP
jgi:hypothetical protein